MQCQLFVHFGVLQQRGVGALSSWGDKIAAMRSRMSSKKDVCIWTPSNGKFSLSSAWELCR